MRALVLALALLAGLKIWIQDSVYRTATGDALLAAYRSRAADACAAVGGTLPAGGYKQSAADWSQAAEPRVAVGNPAVQVRIWDVDNELWNARFRQPYIVLSAEAAGLSCAYDILAGTASITRS